jgi:hypothetical protein
MSNEGILSVLKYYQDGATRGAHAAQALALRERLPQLVNIQYSIFIYLGCKISLIYGKINRF